MRTCRKAFRGIMQASLNFGITIKIFRDFLSNGMTQRPGCIPTPLPGIPRCTASPTRKKSSLGLWTRPSCVLPEFKLSVWNPEWNKVCSHIKITSLNSRNRSRGVYLAVPPHHLHAKLLLCIVGFQVCAVLLDMTAPALCVLDTGIGPVEWRDLLKCLSVAVGLWPWVVFTKWRFYWKGLIVMVLLCKKKDTMRTPLRPGDLPVKPRVFPRSVIQPWRVQWHVQCC